jgi:hypothetical protein
MEDGSISSDGGGLLLRQVECRTGILERFAGCFADHRAGAAFSTACRIGRTASVCVGPWANEDLNTDGPIYG